MIIGGGRFETGDIRGRVAAHFRGWPMDDTCV
jgi:hypothetical protein